MILDSTSVWLLCGIFFAVAALYSSVGHAGASGYLATMALLGVAPETMRPTALTLNILVATIATLRFSGAGQVRWRALWPFVAGSVPMAAVGGASRLHDRSYYIILGFALLASAVVLFWRARRAAPTRLDETVHIPIGPALAIGAGIGLLSGLTGTGGGIFLSPIVLLAGWAGPIATAGIAAPFILANSTTALIAGASSWADLPSQLPWFIGAVLLGGLCGTWIGLRRLPASALFVALSIVLVIAALKLFIAP